LLQSKKAASYLYMGGFRRFPGFPETPFGVDLTPED